MVAGGVDDVEDVAPDLGGEKGGVDGGGEGGQELGASDRRELLGRGTRAGRGEEEVLGLAVGVAEVEAQEEAVARLWGMGKVPAASKGFWVAMTMKGRGSGWEMPSAETWRSSIASRRADWALGEARLSSSAKRMFGEDRSGPEGEDAGVAVEDDRSGDVGGKKVGSELDAPEAEARGNGRGPWPASSSPRRGWSSTRRCPSAMRQQSESRTVSSFPR